MYLLLSFSVLLLNVILVYFSRLMFYPVVVKTCDFENQTITSAVKCHYNNILIIII